MPTGYDVASAFLWPEYTDVHKLVNHYIPVGIDLKKTKNNFLPGFLSDEGTHNYNGNNPAVITLTDMFFYPLM
jgi:hypothetical protein